MPVFIGTAEQIEKAQELYRICETRNSVPEWVQTDKLEECQAVYCPLGGPAIWLTRKEKSVTPLQKRCQELLPVIQAGAEGKTVQSNYGDEHRPRWDDLPAKLATSFFFNGRYRVKPAPQYRPYTPKEACDLLGTWVRGENGAAYDVYAVRANGVALSYNETIPFDRLLAVFKTSCGHPCGVLVED